FQAEDGIRDFHVTGVQTCALPILRGRTHAEHLTLAAQKEGAELIVCVGGDSALHEVTNALYQLGSKAPALSIHPEFQRGSLTKKIGRASCRDRVEVQEGTL